MRHTIATIELLNRRSHLKRSIPTLHRKAGMHFAAGDAETGVRFARQANANEVELAEIDLHLARACQETGDAFLEHLNSCAKPHPRTNGQLAVHTGS